MSGIDRRFRMPKAKALTALVAVALLGGCASGVTQQDATAAPKGQRQAARQSRVVDCSTTGLGIVTTSHCGSNGFDPFSAAAE